MDAPCHSTCSTLKNPHCSMAISTEQRSKFAALHRQWWRLRMSEKLSSWTKNPKQTSKQTAIIYQSVWLLLYEMKLCLGQISWAWDNIQDGLWSTHQWLMMQNLKKEVILISIHQTCKTLITFLFKFSSIKRKICMITSW